MKKQFLILALRNLVKYKTRNLLTGICIAIATAGIIIGLALTNGIIRQTIIGFTGTIVEDVMVFPNTTPLQDEHRFVINNIDEDLEKEKMVFLDLLYRNKDPILNQYDQMEKAIYDIDGIDYVTKKVQFQGAIFSDASSLNAMIMGMEPEGIRRKTNLEMEKGRYLNEHDRLSLIISEKLARRLQVDVGDKLAIIVNMPGGGTEEKQLACKVLSWKKVMKGILAQYYFIKYIVLIFTIVLLLIVCVGVINSIFLSVSERTREIGTMMAMGSKRKSIIALFMLEGTIHSLLSSLSGAAIGVTICLIFEKIGFEAPTEGASNLFGGKYLYPYLSYPLTSDWK
jgi:ABC-type lipoprotein release transport system permease subunit